MNTLKKITALILLVMFCIVPLFEGTALSVEAASDVRVKTKDCTKVTDSSVRLDISINFTSKGDVLEYGYFYGKTEAADTKIVIDKDDKGVTYYI